MVALLIDDDDLFILALRVLRYEKAHNLSDDFVDRNNNTVLFAEMDSLNKGRDALKKYHIDSTIKGE